MKPKLEVSRDVRNVQKALRSSIALAVYLIAFQSSPVVAQSNADVQKVLERLDRIEAENRRLADEVRLLREELRRRTGAGEQATSATVAGSPEPVVPVGEAVAVNSARIEEMAQTKVESSQKLPLKITGMALFNAFMNGRNAGGVENPTTASLTPLSAAGATMRQTVIGLQFQSPQTVLGASINGSVYMDLFGGTTASLNHLLRLRVATVELNWENRSFLIGQDKPIVSPREPTSLAQVGVSPLTNAGNLWLWQPQARYEERVHFGENSGLTAQLGVFQTNEGAANIQADYVSTLDRARPAIQGRFEVWHRWSGNRRMEFAPAFHRSDSHVVGVSVPSELVSVDWLVAPVSRVEFTGMYYSGQNIANLGALRQGFTILSDYNRGVIPVHSKGGWAQLHLAATERLSFNIYGGQHNDRGRDLVFGGVTKNQGYFANTIYRLAPNFLISLEGGQVRTSFLNNGTRSVNHYDLAFAYLF